MVTDRVKHRATFDLLLFTDGGGYRRTKAIARRGSLQLEFWHLCFFGETFDKARISGEREDLELHGGILTTQFVAENVSNDQVDVQMNAVF